MITAFTACSASQVLANLSSSILEATMTSSEAVQNQYSDKDQEEADLRPKAGMEEAEGVHASRGSCR